jgi:hypothetical protein
MSLYYKKKVHFIYQYTPKKIQDGRNLDTNDVGRAHRVSFEEVVYCAFWSVQTYGMQCHVLES